MVAKKIVIAEPEEEEVVAKAASSAEGPASTPTENNLPESTPDPTEVPDTFRSFKLPASKSQTVPRINLPSPSMRGLGKEIKRWRRLVAFFGIVVVLVIVGVLLHSRHSNPLPKPLQQQVKFTTFYPHSSVGKYKYVAGSGSYDGGKLTYNYGAGGPVIRVSEQALTVQAPDLHKLQGFSVFQAPAGQAAIADSGNVLNGILIAHKTLIILNGLNGVTKQDFTQIINSLGQ